MDNSEYDRPDKPSESSLRAKLGFGILAASSPLWVTWIVAELSAPEDAIALVGVTWTCIAGAGIVWLFLHIFKRHRVAGP